MRSYSAVPWLSYIAQVDKDVCENMAKNIPEAIGGEMEGVILANSLIIIS